MLMILLSWASYRLWSRLLSLLISSLRLINYPRPDTSLDSRENRRTTSIYVIPSSLETTDYINDRCAIVRSAIVLISSFTRGCPLTRHYGDIFDERARSYYGAIRVFRVVFQVVFEVRAESSAFAERVRDSSSEKSQRRRVGPAALNTLGVGDVKKNYATRNRDPRMWVPADLHRTTHLRPKGRR